MGTTYPEATYSRSHGRHLSNAKNKHTFMVDKLEYFDYTAHRH